MALNIYDPSADIYIVIKDVLSIKHQKIFIYRESLIQLNTHIVVCINIDISATV